MVNLSYNYVLTCAVVAWSAAQVIKTIVHLIKTRKFNAERLFGSGGMPSSHSSLVCSATIAICRKCGEGSPEFALMFILAMIVMYDAMGVRRAAGQHARELNKMHKLFVVKEIFTIDEIKRDNKKKELKEFIGHTPFEVLGGALLGIIIAMIVPIG